MHGSIQGATAIVLRGAVCCLQELRSANTSAIRAARAAGGPSCSDSQGYDLITIPQVGCQGRLHPSSFHQFTERCAI